MKTFAIVVAHGVIPEGKREFFITAETKKDAYWAAKSHLMYCGDIDGYEYILDVEEVEETEEATEETSTIEEATKSTKKTKKYVAFVRDSKTKQLMVIEREYPTKKAFAEDLRGNGYRIRFISTPEKFDEDCEKYHEAIEKTKAIHKAQYETYKNSVMKKEMTFEQYRAWLKAI